MVFCKEDVDMITQMGMEQTAQTPLQITTSLLGIHAESVYTAICRFMIVCFVCFWSLFMHNGKMIYWNKSILLLCCICAHCNYSCRMCLQTIATFKRLFLFQTSTAWSPACSWFNILVFVLSIESLQNHRSPCRLRTGSVPLCFKVVQCLTSWAATFDIVVSWKFNKHSANVDPGSPQFFTHFPKYHAPHLKHGEEHKARAQWLHGMSMW